MALLRYKAPVDYTVQQSMSREKGRQDCDEER